MYTNKYGKGIPRKLLFLLIILNYAEVEVSIRTSFSMSSKTSKAGGKRKNYTERKQNSVRFLAGNKRPRLSNCRSSDDHQNTIEENVTDEN